MTLWRTYETEFEAAHHIKDHPKCGQIHGHSYYVKVWIGDHPTDTFFDFAQIKDSVEANIIKNYDHHDLGNTTCETIAMSIHNKLSLLWPIRKIKVQVKETSKFGVEID